MNPINEYCTMDDTRELRMKFGSNAVMHRRTIDKDSGTLLSYQGTKHRERPVDPIEAALPIEDCYKFYYQDAFYLLGIRGQKKLGQHHYQVPIMRLQMIQNEKAINISSDELPVTKEAFLNVLEALYNYRENHSSVTNKKHKIYCRTDIIFGV